MEFTEYDKLRKKISKKDFEGNNKGLDKWLYSFSFVGNFVSIFFSYFLVYPALLKAITINLFDGIWATIIAFIFTNVFLVIYEVIKRYLAQNFSSDYVSCKGKIKIGMIGWFIALLSILVLSFYLSLSGSKNLATTSLFKNTLAQKELNITTDSLYSKFENQKKIYLEDNINLRSNNNELRSKLLETPMNYNTIRKDYQQSIDKNTKIINDNQSEIEKIDKKLMAKIEDFKINLNSQKSDNQTEDKKNITLFIIIAIFSELIIIFGVHFRQWYEYQVFTINQQKFEKTYVKKERYLALLSYVYRNGKVTLGDKVISGAELKKIVADNANIPNSNIFVDNFLKDMDNLNVFTVQGKKRFIACNYQDAIENINHFDDSIRILENLK